MSLELFCEKFSLPVINDIVKIALGNELGRGVYRTAYAAGWAANFVLKINNPEIVDNFANAREWEVWNRVRETELSRWFAPSLEISFGGLVLIQTRTSPVTLKELMDELPRVPAFFTDLKVANWGRIDGRIVCHDYGNHLLIENGMTKRMRKADWWE